MRAYANLDTEELIKAILQSPYLVIAGDESLRNGDTKYQILPAFYHRGLRGRGGGCFGSAA